MKDRTIILENIENVGSLGNKDMMIRNYCESGDIIIDIDADDSLIGRQVLQVLNTLYQTTDQWFIYSNNIFKK